MATRQKYEKLSSQERQNRYFSEEFKKKKVSELERNISSIAEICREYQVSNTAINGYINIQI
jgi:transposase-like protein